MYSVLEPFSFEAARGTVNFLNMNVLCTDKVHEHVVYYITGAFMG
jgi:hypothetical protein